MQQATNQISLSEETIKRVINTHNSYIYSVQNAEYFNSNQRKRLENVIKDVEMFEDMLANY